MSTADLAQLLALPADERFRLVELIWESLVGKPGNIPLSEAHREALEAELEAHRGDPDDVLTLEQLMAKVRGPR